MTGPESRDVSWLTKTTTVAAVVLPGVADAVREHQETIPKETRQQKLYLTLVGIALCLTAVILRQSGWGAWWWGSGGFVGANIIAGDYRRLLFRTVFAILSDTTTFITQAASKIKEIKAALLGLKNGTNAGPDA